FHKGNDPKGKTREFRLRAASVCSFPRFGFRNIDGTLCV
ncbi:hypothetical protein M068_1461, partial [Bacteroides fragilis str. J38-1]